MAIRTIQSRVDGASNTLSSGGAESATAGMLPGLTMRREGFEKRASGAGARFPAATSLPPRTVQVGSWKVIAWATASGCVSMGPREWQIREPASARSSTITTRIHPWFWSPELGTVISRSAGSLPPPSRGREGRSMHPTQVLKKPFRIRLSVKQRSTYRI